jgi:L-amino acid N-acyltransferase YncA
MGATIKIVSRTTMVAYTRPRMAHPMRSKVEVLPAEEGDLEAINDIYNHYVPISDCTMETEIVSLDARWAWFSENGRRYPILVAKADGKVIGWASLSRHRVRGAYDHTAEDAVYVRDGWQHKGVGTLLLGELIAAARVREVHSIVAVINADHVASLRLHRKLGFQDVALLREAGFKFGRWIDIRYLQLIL